MLLNEASLKIVFESNEVFITKTIEINKTHGFTCMVGFLNLWHGQLEGFNI